MISWLVGLQCFSRDLDLGMLGTTGKGNLGLGKVELVDRCGCRRFRRVGGDRETLADGRLGSRWWIRFSLLICGVAGRS